MSEIETISPSEERRRLKLEGVKNLMLKESMPFKKAFKTLDGQEALNLLKKEFYERPKLVGGDVYETITRAAQRDLVQYIIDMINYTGE